MTFYYYNDLTIAIIIFINLIFLIQNSIYSILEEYKIILKNIFFQHLNSIESIKTIYNDCQKSILVNDRINSNIFYFEKIKNLNQYFDNIEEKIFKFMKNKLINNILNNILNI